MVTLSSNSEFSCSSLSISVSALEDTMDETLSTLWYSPQLSSTDFVLLFFFFFFLFNLSPQKQNTTQEARVVTEPRVNIVAPNIHA